MTPARLHGEFPYIHHSKKSLWELNKPLLYCVGHANSNDKIEVPKGFITDFASIPRPVRFFFPTWQITGRPPVIHDWLYASHQRSRKEADEIFYEAMIAAGYDVPRAWLQYRAVRAGGVNGYTNLSPKQFEERTPHLFKQYFAG